MIDRPRLTIHAGAGKTGSTAIQNWLKRNRDELRKKGRVYTGLFFEELDESHARQRPAELFANALTQGPDGLLATIKERLSRIPNDTGKAQPLEIIWSNEGLFESVRRVGPAIGEIAKGYDCRLIVYLRRQDDWFVSAYKQWGIKHKTYPGPTIEFDTWYASNKGRGDYTRPLRRWEEFIPRENIYVKIYDAEASIVDSFVEFLGLSTTDFKEVSEVRPNLTPSPTVLSLFKLFNSQFDDEIYPDVLGRFLHRSEIFGKSFRSVPLDVSGPSSERRQEILTEFAECNRNLKRYVCDNSFESLIPSGVEPRQETDETVSTEQALAAILYAAVHMENRINDLENELAELRTNFGKGNAKSKSDNQCP